MIEKLIKIQQELKVPKNNRNTFGNYNYRSCEDIVEAVKPLCARYDLVLTLSDEVVEVGGRVYVKAEARLQSFEVSTMKDVLTTQACYGYAREAEVKKGMDEAQITGSASSYARKYALNGLFAIDDTKDADATNNHEMSTTEAFTILRKASTLSELKTAFEKLPQSIKADAEVIALKDELKNNLQ
jgi:hypothetical protein